MFVYLPTGPVYHLQSNTSCLCAPDYRRGVRCAAVRPLAASYHPYAALQIPGSCINNLPEQYAIDASCLPKPKEEEEEQQPART